MPRVLEAVFEPTLRMITTNFEDFPEHRLAFFKLLKATNTHCFAALFAIPPEHHKLVVDSVVWAFKHTERTVAETNEEYRQRAGRQPQRRVKGFRVPPSAEARQPAQGIE